MFKSHVVSQAGRWLYGIGGAFFAWQAVTYWSHVAAWGTVQGLLVIGDVLCAVMFSFSAMTGRDWRWN